MKKQPRFRFYKWSSTTLTQITVTVASLIIILLGSLFITSRPHQDAGQTGTSTHQPQASVATAKVDCRVLTNGSPSSKSTWPTYTTPDGFASISYPPQWLRHPGDHIYPLISNHNPSSACEPFTPASNHIAIQIDENTVSHASVYADLYNCPAQNTEQNSCTTKTINNVPYTIRQAHFSGDNDEDEAGYIAKSMYYASSNKLIALTYWVPDGPDQQVSLTTIDAITSTLKISQ